MTWISFFTYLGMCYGAYYFAIIIMDGRPKQSKATDQTEVLTFSETVVPEKIALEDFNLSVSSAATPASTGLGGVSIKDLFALARKDAIEFTKSVSF